MAHIDRVDVADPRYISLAIVKERITHFYRRVLDLMVQRINHFHPRVPNLEKLESASQGVFETNELLVHILSFLPPINVSGVRRVSKSWNEAVAASLYLQEKMFLRLSKKPQEIWTVDTEHRPGANLYWERHPELNDTELKFRRVDDDLNTDKNYSYAVSLNPVLHPSPTDYPNVIRLHYGRQGKQVVDFNGWVDALQNEEAGLWKTHVTDPPCHKTGILLFSLCFGDAPFVGPPAQHERWKPENDSLEGHPAKKDPLESYPITATVCFAGNSYLESAAGFTMGDAVKAAFEAHGYVQCTFSDAT